MSVLGTTKQIHRAIVLTLGNKVVFFPHSLFLSVCCGLVQGPELLDILGDIDRGMVLQEGVKHLLMLSQHLLLFVQLLLLCLQNTHLS